MDTLPPILIQRKSFRRKHLSVRVLASGVIKVIASIPTPRREISQFLNQYKDWINKNLNECQRIKNKYPPKKFIEGEKFLLKGQEYPLILRPTIKKDPEFQIVHSQFTLFLPSKSPPEIESLRQCLRQFYENLGRQELKKSIDDYSQKMNLYPKAVSFRSQKTRWGSCSQEGHVSLNWRLAAAPPECLDYVVVHELCHLKYMNHSQKFWQLVERYSPHWKIYRKWLRDNRYAFDFLAKKSELYPN